MAPSGVQKERIEPNDLFVCDLDGNVVREARKPLKVSQCAPLFMNAFSMRGARACIHTHSQHAVMATLLCKDVFTITHQEMIKVQCPCFIFCSPHHDIASLSLSLSLSLSDRASELDRQRRT